MEPQRKKRTRACGFGERGEGRPRSLQKVLREKTAADPAAVMDDVGGSLRSKSITAGPLRADYRSIRLFRLDFSRAPSPAPPPADQPVFWHGRK